MSRNSSSGPSLKKKFVGLIRQISQPGGSSGSGEAQCMPRPDTFIHKYLQGECRGVQPTIVYGRSCEELPSRPLRGPRPHVLAAYTGPAGGLTSVNRGGHPPLQRDEADLDYIDADDATSDAQPNAYVTSQKPPPRKTPYYDLAAYFRKREPEAKGRGGDGEGGVRAGGSDDSLDCEAPSWRGEAPSPLSPNPGRAPPSAFLQFGDGPLNYGLRLPRGEDGCCLNGVGAGSGGGDGSDAGSGGGSDGNGAYSNTGRCWQGDAGGEAVLVSCTDEGGGVVVNQLLDPQLDQNLNPLITLHTAVLDNNHHHQTTDVNTNDNAHTHDNHTDQQQIDDNHTDVQPDDNHPTSALYENGNYTAEENPVDRNGEAEDGEDASTLEEDSEGGNSLASQRARFLTLDLVEAGLLAVPDPDLKRSEKEEIAGLLNWNRPHQRAYGLSTTLYERHPLTSERAGNPIADAFGVIAREDSAILALADGVNWGEKASIAARCAIHGCLHHLNTALYSPAAAPPETTTDVFVALLRSFHAAHSLILQEDGMLTTLTAAVVMPLANREQYVVCVCNVGDSLAYVFSQKHGVREITQGSHDIYSMRDMRDALGALGPVDGTNPELNNLTCSLTYCEAGDIVFLTSDGISDNFDPVVGKFAIPRKETPTASKDSQTNGKEQQNGVQDGRGNEPSKEEQSKQQSHPSSSRQGQQAAGRQQQQQNNKGSGRQHGSASRQHHSQHSSGRQQQQQQQRGGRVRRTPSGSKEQAGSGHARAGKQPVSNVKSVGAGLPEHEEEEAKDPFLPLVEAHQRHELTLLRMEDLLRCGLTSPGPVTTAQGLCLEMVHFATKLTVAKRRILEDPDLYSSTSKELSRSHQRNRRRKVCEKLALVPGKLDHATVVAYVVGLHLDPDAPDPEHPVVRHPVFRPAPLASPDSTRSLVSQLEEARPADLPTTPKVD
ncbi:uncharacterized protein LOC127004468 isoform X2 [Eriocheir sinensis]|uniref:uncharacterized protein LOC127004468 isoform X2 n=1 Tax=Eriocheir sinensis TaxID=95602 RepID=UPI0021C6A5B6|nr:uncharacterized protein LOC127004468 isoform X2 [Eriocheir sinensis]